MLGTCRALVVFVDVQFVSGIHFEIQASKTKDLSVGEGDGLEAILCPLGVELKTTEGWVLFDRMLAGLISRTSHFDLVGWMCVCHPLPSAPTVGVSCGSIVGRQLFGRDGQRSIEGSGRRYIEFTQVQALREEVRPYSCHVVFIITVVAGT